MKTEIIQLNNCEVEIKDSFTWGEMEKVQMALGSADIEQADVSKTMEANYVMLEVAIVSIKVGEEKVNFTKDWVRNLEFNDALKLVTAVTDKVTGKKK